MAGIGDPLFNLFQPDPEQAIADWSNEQQRKNRAAIGLDANGNPLPAAATAPAVPAADGSAPLTPGDHAAIQAQVSGTMQPGQEPNATKTPQSLGALLMNLQQRQEADQGLNQALGMGFAAFAQPRDREMVSRMFNQQQPDVNQIGMTQMNLAGQQQGQDRMNALGALVRDPVRGKAIADSLNIPQADLIARYEADPQGVGQMIQNFRQPTDPLKNIMQLPTVGGSAAAGPAGPSGPKGSPANGTPLSDIISAVTSSVAGPTSEAMLSAQNAWRAAHKGQPDSAMPWQANNLQSFGQYAINEKGKEDDRTSASAALVDNNETAQRMQTDLETLKDSPGLKSILTTPAKRAIAQTAMEDKGATDVPTIMAKYVGLNSQEADAIAVLKRIGGATTETAMKGMAGTGTRVTQAEVGPLKDAIATTQNLNQSYDSYIHGALGSAITRAKKTIATNFGATGNVKNMDPQYAPWLDDNFKPGGELYKEGSGAEALPAAKPIPPDMLAQVKQEASNYSVGKDDLLDNLQQAGFDTKRLRHTPVSGW